MISIGERVDLVAGSSSVGWDVVEGEVTAVTATTVTIGVTGEEPEEYLLEDLEWSDRDREWFLLYEEAQVVPA